MNVSNDFSVQTISSRAKSLFHRGVDVKETRKQNLRALILQEARTNGAHGAAKRTADKIKTDPAYLSQLLSEKVKADVGDRLARQIERELEKPHGWMDTPHVFVEGVEQETAQYNVGGGFRDVPVVGFAIATPDEDGYFDDMGFAQGAAMEYLPWPTRDPNAYGLRVRGDSMQPRIRPGQIIVMEPGAGISPLDDVLVRMRARKNEPTGRKMVKQLLHRRSDEVTLGSINQAYRQITLPLSDIEAMHFIAAVVSRAAMTKESL